MIYNRKIEVRRTKAGQANQPTVIGLVGYSGTETGTDVGNPNSESVLYKNAAASIQAGAGGRKKDSALPQDAVSNPSWNIYLPLGGIPFGAIRDRDLIIDDLGYRYEAGQAYPHILGWKLVCIRLEM